MYGIIMSKQELKTKSKLELTFDGKISRDFERKSICGDDQLDCGCRCVENLYDRYEDVEGEPNTFELPKEKQTYNVSFYDPDTDINVEIVFKHETFELTILGCDLTLSKFKQYAQIVDIAYTS